MRKLAWTAACGLAVGAAIAGLGADAALGGLLIVMVVMLCAPLLEE